MKTSIEYVLITPLYSSVLSESLNWGRQCSKCSQMSIEFSDADTSSVIGGLSSPGALVGESLSVWACGVGSGCQRSDVWRGSICSSLPIDESDLPCG